MFNWKLAIAGCAVITTAVIALSFQKERTPEVHSGMQLDHEKFEVYGTVRFPRGPRWQTPWGSWYAAERTAPFHLEILIGDGVLKSEDYEPMAIREAAAAPGEWDVKYDLILGVWLLIFLHVLGLWAVVAALLSAWRRRARVRQGDAAVATTSDIQT